jgi:Zn-finger protein
MYPIKTFNFNSTYKKVKIRIGTCRNLTKKHKKNSKIEIMSRILEKEKKSKTKKYIKKYSYLKLKTIFLGKKNIVKIAKSPLEV